MSAALLIIDMQNALREETRCKDEFGEAVEYINATAALFRKKGLPVVLVQDTEIAEGPGSAGFEVVPAIERGAADIVVHKEYSNAFWKTDLENILREKGVEFVVCSGFAAEHCVLFTYNGAVERGFKAAVLQRGIAGYDAGRIRDTQLVRPAISYQALKYFIE
jgi:nicotinamidase-related amidase